MYNGYAKIPLTWYFCALHIHLSCTVECLDWNPGILFHLDFCLLVSHSNVSSETADLAVANNEAICPAVRRYGHVL